MTKVRHDMIDLTVDGEEYHDVPRNLFAGLREGGPLKVILEMEGRHQAFRPGRDPGSFRLVLNVLEAIAAAPAGTPVDRVLIIGERTKEEVRFYGVLTDREIRSCRDAQQTQLAIRRLEERQAQTHRDLRVAREDAHAASKGMEAAQWQAAVFVMMHMQTRHPHLSWPEVLYDALENDDGMETLRHMLPPSDGPPTHPCTHAGPVWTGVLRTMGNVVRFRLGEEFDAWKSIKMRGL